MLEVVAQLLPLLALQAVLPAQLLLFVDNEPARHALTKGFGNCRNLNRLLEVAWQFFEKQSWWPVWQRVASSANVSDGVSRFDFAFAYDQGWGEYEKFFRRLLSSVEAFPSEEL